MSYKDPEKQRAYQREWCKKNRNTTTREKRREMVRKAKEKPCVACGNVFPPIAMDLHHLDPSSKDAMVSHLEKSGSLDALQKEIDKCVAICACCHRMLHGGVLELPSLQTR